ncbi:hypothetical protein [Streptomyces sp. NPDC056683]|uniref:hypothetical protein n=1 Tax=Streptomyces sp. NPDC056683 TaxID=3345910 RepID=UPI0036BC67D3
MRNDGASPHDAVTSLVSRAMHVAAGLLPDPTVLRDQIEDLEDELAEFTRDGEADLTDVALRPTRLPAPRP